MTERLSGRRSRDRLRRVPPARPPPSGPPSPPEYHRSYTLTLTETSARVVVGSYGDVLHDQTAPMTASVWAELMAGLPAIADLHPEPVDAGCGGGTSQDLLIDSAEGALVDYQTPSCGGQGEATTAAITA